MWLYGFICGVMFSVFWLLYVFGWNVFWFGVVGFVFFGFAFYFKFRVLLQLFDLIWPRVVIFMVWFCFCDLIGKVLLTFRLAVDCRFGYLVCYSCWLFAAGVLVCVLGFVVVVWILLVFIVLFKFVLLDGGIWFICVLTCDFYCFN